MTLDLAAFKKHCNIVDDIDDELLERLLGAAGRHVERILGYALGDAEVLPVGAPPDLEHAVLMLAAHWYENREATLVGLASQDVPFGVSDILNEHRRYSFG